MKKNAFSFPEMLIALTIFGFITVGCVGLYSKYTDSLNEAVINVHSKMEYTKNLGINKPVQSGYPNGEGAYMWFIGDKDIDYSLKEETGHIVRTSMKIQKFGKGITLSHSNNISGNRLEFNTQGLPVTTDNKNFYLCLIKEDKDIKQIEIDSLTGDISVNAITKNDMKCR